MATAAPTKTTAPAATEAAAPASAPIDSTDSTRSTDMRGSTEEAAPAAPAASPELSSAPGRPAARAGVRMPRLYRAITWLQGTYQKLDTGQRLYLNCALVVLLYFVTFPLHRWWNFVGLLMLAIVFWFAGMVYDALTLYKRIYATHIGKGLLLLAFTGLTNLSIALANLRINGIAGVDPSKFPHTEIFVAILSIPFIGLLILMTLYAASVLFLPVYGFFFFAMDAKAKAFFSAGLIKQDESAYPVITGILRFVGFFVFVGIVIFFAKQKLVDYDRFMTQTAEQSIYQLEMYEKAPCDVPAGARVAFLDDDNIVYALRVGAELKFFPQPCKKGAK
ncbi:MULTISPECIES: hypothetical protein [Burkholderia]|uniref:hypothetical protein n=1 Tax=Burkholderia TaxID=32008 RepID=UPI001CF77391|nr:MULTISPECIES: hypothetical protein [Burkholderia]